MTNAPTAFHDAYIVFCHSDPAHDLRFGVVEDFRFVAASFWAPPRKLARSSSVRGRARALKWRRVNPSLLRRAG